jgi:DNA-binding NtrC family response regulator
MSSRVRIVSRDAAFAESIGTRLERWGLSVAVESELERITPALVAEAQVDVVLLDVRRYEDGVLRWLSSIKQIVPALEVILLNVAGEIRVSIDGMRAGASHELSAPFDTAALRSAVSAALRRRNKRLGGAKLSLLERFERAMSAATFAQAGEFDTAREMLDEEKPKRRASDKPGRK